MTKRNLANSIAVQLGLSQLETKEIVQKTLDAIINILASEGRIELRNFGVFEVTKRKARQSRNPRTGEKVMVGEKLAVTFRPGRNVEERVARECGSFVWGSQIETPTLPVAFRARACYHDKYWLKIDLLFKEFSDETSTLAGRRDR